MAKTTSSHVLLRVSGSARTERTFGVQFGVQFERNSTELRSNRPNEQGREPLSATPTLGLGAGRSQVQILSPRCEKRLFGWAAVRQRGRRLAHEWATKAAFVAQFGHDLGGSHAATTGRRACFQGFSRPALFEIGRHAAADRGVLGSKSDAAMGRLPGACRRGQASASTSCVPTRRQMTCGSP
jgi:hypothetical protein